MSTQDLLAIDIFLITSNNTNSWKHWYFEGRRNRGACRIRNVELKHMVSSDSILWLGENLVAIALVQEESSAAATQKEKHSHNGSHIHILWMGTGAQHPYVKSLVQQQVQHLWMQF